MKLDLQYFGGRGGGVTAKAQAAKQSAKAGNGRKETDAKQLAKGEALKRK